MSLVHGREQSKLSSSNPQKRGIGVDGEVVPLSSSKESVGDDVGRRVGAFV